MDTLLLITRFLVAIVFGAAAIGKFLDLPGSVAASEGFGVPQRFSRLVGYSLPVVEMAVAVGLISAASAPFAAAAGTLLMVAFIVAISINLARGKRPDCHCFGKLHSAPIGPETLVRNGLIGIGTSLVLFVGPGAGLLSWLQGLGGRESVLLALLTAAVVVIGWQWSAFGRLSGRASAMVDRISMIESLVNGDSHSDVPGPAVGAEAPGFLLASIGKGMVTLESLKAAGKPVVLVFAEPTCSVCNMVMPKIARWSKDLAESVTVAIISSGTEEANRNKVNRYGLQWVLLQDSREVTMSYRVPGTPSAVLLDRNGVVAAPMSYGPDAIMAMLDGISGAVNEAAQAQTSPGSAGPMPTPSRETTRPSSVPTPTMSSAD